MNGQPIPDGDVALKVDGRIVSGVERFELQAPAEGVPRSFSVSASKNPALAAARALRPHLPVTVQLGGDTVLTGWTDRIASTYDKGSHIVTLVGRGLCEIIVDCQIDVFSTGWEFKATTIGQAARAICKPYNITVVLPDGDVDLPDSLKIVAVFPGYQAYGFLEEFTRSVGLLMFENELGQLVLTSGGSGGRAGSAIVEGANVERVEAMASADQRYATYYVLSNNRSLLDVGEAIVAQASDPEGSFLSPRVRIIPQEFPDVSIDFSKRRASWEANRRWGRSKIVRVTVTGWRDGQGKLWTPNSNVRVKLPTAGINEDRTITDVIYRRDARGTVSVLTLMPKEALSVQPYAVPVIP